MGMGMGMAAGPDTSMTSGAFARATGLSAKALRLYDSSGLLLPEEVDPHSGYRYYAPPQVGRAQRIALLRRAGMPLARVATLLDADDGEAALLLDRWWSEQEQDAARREGIVAYLRDELLQQSAPDYPVHSRRVQERTVATATLHVTQADLVPTIIRLRTGLRAHLGRGGARHTEEHWVIYHGAVTPDSDGPIEVCVPYEGSATPARDLTLRVEPGHDEAFVALTAAECSYPPILHAYAAVERWVDAHGTPDGRVREVYPVAWDDRKDAGPVAEIARPYLPQFS